MRPYAGGGGVMFVYIFLRGPDINHGLTGVPPSAGIKNKGHDYD